MTITVKAFIWAAIIIGAAILSKLNGFSDGGAMGVTFGLMGAAYASLYSSKSCGSC
ncbi:hypothetical protein [Sphingomicrobium sediminis]|uniref:Uncharacterized protein n=1 Tax=Sphingomicrobium sediminis TaxID=2950949 RepID=A0A9X2EI01_9SPHN|nr:hypothetical protein [Sphingomicrobium sediminis]MCM8557900.1 hypothetical protein [Sphingomicrobium sediminis]